jgi:hypothetical protein
MSEGAMSPADIMAMMNNGNANWNNNPFLWLIFLAMMGNGNFGWGNNNGNAAMQGALTRAELADGLNNQTVLNDFRNVESEIGAANLSLNNAVNSGFNGIQQSLCSGFGSVNSNISNKTFDTINAMNGGFNSLNNAITQAGFNNQMGFCNVGNAISGLKYEMAQTCCELKNAMHFEGEATRGLIQANTIQCLRDKLDEKNSVIQSQQSEISNAQQTQYILNALGKYYPAGQIQQYNW